MISNILFTSNIFHDSTTDFLRTFIIICLRKILRINLPSKFTRLKIDFGCQQQKTFMLFLLIIIVSYSLKISPHDPNMQLFLSILQRV